MRVFLLLASVLCPLSCLPTAAAGEDSPELEKLRGEITELVGPARCMNLVQCRFAALGLNACGGPAEFVVYSWMSTDKAALETKIAEYNFLREDLRKHQAADGCVVLPEPVAACINGRCVLSGFR